MFRQSKKMKNSDEKLIANFNNKKNTKGRGFNFVDNRLNSVTQTKCQLFSAKNIMPSNEKTGVVEKQHPNADMSTPIQLIRGTVCNAPKNIHHQPFVIRDEQGKFYGVPFGVVVKEGDSVNFVINVDYSYLADNVIVIEAPQSVEMSSLFVDRAESKEKAIKKTRTRKMHDLSEGESESDDPSIVWRSLRKDEDPMEDGVLPPVGHDPTISASAHITAGSKAKKKSPWVSTSRSLKVAGAWASETDKRVAKLKIPDGLMSSDIFDMTKEEDALKIFPKGKGSSLNTAKASQEVVIKGGLKPEQVLGLYEAKKISVSEYNDIKARMDDGEEVYIDGKKVYSIFRSRTMTKKKPIPRLLLELNH